MVRVSPVSTVRSCRSYFAWYASCRPSADQLSELALVKASRFRSGPPSTDIVKMPLSVPFDRIKAMVLPSGDQAGMIASLGWRKLLNPFCADDLDVKVKHALGGVSSPIPREYNLFSVRRKCRPPYVSGQCCQRRDTNVLIGGFSRPSRFAFAMHQVERPHENQERSNHSEQ